jgi:hypothetical protein
MFYVPKAEALSSLVIVEAWFNTKALQMKLSVAFLKLSALITSLLMNNVNCLSVDGT